jgi:hypothetical protein
MLRNVVLTAFVVFASGALANEKILVRADIILEKGAFTPAGCVIATPYPGNMGDQLGNQSVEIDMVQSEGSVSQGAWEIETASPFGKILYQVRASRDPKNGSQLTISPAIFVSGVRRSRVDLFFNRANELKFPFTQIGFYLGSTSDGYCYKATLGLTPTEY